MSLLSTYASPYNENSTITENFNDDQPNKKNMINKKRQNRSANRTLKKSNSLGDSQKNQTSSRVSNMIETLKQHNTYYNDSDIDESLVLKAIREWYLDTEHEEDTTSESDSDCE